MTPTHRSDDMTDNLRDAAQAVLDRWDSLDWKAAPTADYMYRLRAALAAAPQPAPEPVAWRVRVKSDDAEEWSLLPAGGGADYRDREGYECQPLYKHPPQPAPMDRETLVEVILDDSANWDEPLVHTEAEAIAEALLARGLRLRLPEAGNPVSSPSETSNVQNPHIALLDTQIAAQDCIIKRLEAEHASETMAWAVVGPNGKIAEFSSYLMAFAVRQDAIDHALPDEGERVAPVTIRIGEATP